MGIIGMFNFPVIIIIYYIYTYIDNNQSNILNFVQIKYNA